jgi:hypothetical protein
MSFEDIENCVLQYINTNNIKVTKNVNLKKSGNNFDKDNLNIFTGKWQIYQTSGNDNDCMIHSLLNDCSNTFRKLKEDDKNTVARYFRLNKFREIVKKGITLPIDKDKADKIINSENFLESGYLQYFCEHYKFYIIVFSGANRDGVSTYNYEFYPLPPPEEKINTSYKTVVFNNTGGGHFSAMSIIKDDIAKLLQDDFYLDISESEKVFKDNQEKQKHIHKNCEFTTNQNVYNVNDNTIGFIKSFGYQEINRVDHCTTINMVYFYDNYHIITEPIENFKNVNGKCIYDPKSITSSPPIPGTKHLTSPQLDFIFDNPIQYNGKYPKYIDIILQHQEKRFNELEGLLCDPTRRVHIPGYEKNKQGIPTFPFPYFINIGTGLAAEQFYPNGSNDIDGLIIVVNKTNFKDIIYTKTDKGYVFNKSSTNIFTQSVKTLGELKNILTNSPNENNIICFNYLVMMYKLNKLANSLYQKFSKNVFFLDDDNFAITSRKLDNLIILVWGANIGNWNNDDGVNILGEGQAKAIKKQRPGSFGIVTTPLSFPINETDIKTNLLSDDKTKYTNNCSSVKLPSHPVTKTINMNIMTYNINRSSVIKNGTTTTNIESDRIIGLKELINKLYNKYTYFDFIGFQEIGENKKILYKLNDFLREKGMEIITELGYLSCYYNRSIYIKNDKHRKLHTDDYSVTFGNKRSIYFHIFDIFDRSDSSEQDFDYIVLLNFHLEHPNNGDGHDLNIKNINKILVKLNNVLQKLSRKKFEFIIVGDFNNDGANLQKYIDIVNKFITKYKFNPIDYNSQHTIVGTCCKSNMKKHHNSDYINGSSKFSSYDNIFTTFKDDTNSDYRNYIYPSLNSPMIFKSPVKPTPKTVGFNIKSATSDHIPVIATIPIKYQVLSPPPSSSPPPPPPRSPSSSPPQPSSPPPSLPKQIVPIAKKQPFTKTKEITSLTPSTTYTTPEIIKLEENEKIPGIEEVKMPDTIYQKKIEHLKLEILFDIFKQIEKKIE